MLEKEGETGVDRDEMRGGEAGRGERDGLRERGWKGWRLREARRNGEKDGCRKEG